MTQQPLDYTPPAAAVMKARQDEPDALRYLIAQRRIHSKAKFWQGVSWIGLLLIGLAAPVISVIWSDLALWMGAIAGLWIFLGRTLLRWRVSELTTRGAATQEVFDYYVFGMPTTVIRSTLPTVEDISELAGDESGFRSVAKAEALLAWYPIDEANPGQVAVAIAQRANASYSDRLLRTTVKLYVTAGGPLGRVLSDPECACESLADDVPRRCPAARSASCTRRHRRHPGHQACGARPRGSCSLDRGAAARRANQAHRGPRPSCMARTNVRVAYFHPAGPELALPKDARQE